MNRVQGRRVLVTGGSGFLGRHLLQRLGEEDARVFCLSHPKSSSSKDSRECVVLETDIRERNGVFRVFGSCHPEVVFHLAAAGVSDHNLSPRKAFAVNVQGTANVLEASKQVGVESFVHVGTSYEYCDPATAYIASKFAAWAFVSGFAREKSLPAVCLRLFHVYGPGQPPPALVSAAISAALRGQNFKMTPGEQKRDFVYVEDVIEGMVCAASHSDIGCMTLDLGTGQGTAIKDLVRLIYDMAGSEGCPLIGALPYREWEVMQLVADAQRSKSTMGWRSHVGLEEGIAKTIKWYRQQMEVEHD